MQSIQLPKPAHLWPRVIVRDNGTSKHEREQLFDSMPGRYRKAVKLSTASRVGPVPTEQELNDGRCSVPHKRDSGSVLARHAGQIECSESR